MQPASIASARTPSPKLRFAAVSFALALCIGDVFASSTISRNSAFDYEPSSGLLTKEIVEPADGSLCVVTEHERDALGRIKKTTLRNCKGNAAQMSGGVTEATQPVAGDSARVEDRVTNFTFTADGRFVATTTNAEGHTETTDYNVSGVAKSLTGPNALVTQWAYDSLGRKRVELRADGTGATWAYQYCTTIAGGTDGNCPTIAGAVGSFSVTETPVKGPIDLVAQTTGAAIGPYSKTYFDALSRPIRAETQGFDGNGSARRIFQDTEYDSIGRVSRKSRPYFQGDTAAWTSFGYDVLGRVISTTEPTAGGTATSTADFNGLVTTHYDPLGKPTVETRDVTGQVASVKDPLGFTLSKTYDALGNLIQTVDPKGNVTSIDYDTRGRRKKLYDPDMGVWQYEYNAFGEMVKQTDPKTQVTSTQYDRLGRVVVRVEPTQNGNWYYDKYASDTSLSTSTCTKGIGKLCEVVVGNGFTRKHVYDSLGRLSSTTSNVGSAYVASVTYDATTGRVDTQTFPGGLRIQNVYTTLGFLRQVIDVDQRTATGANATLWTANDLNAEGKILQQTYGNGVVTTNDYWVDNRLNSTRAGTNGVVQTLTHTYDLLGRLVTRNDFITGVGAIYGYDDLGRVLNERRFGGAISPDQVIEWAYDSIGNMVTRREGGVTHTYNYASSGTGSLRPHAVANVSGAVDGVTLPQYAYDANGNLTGGANRTVAWTSFDKVQSIDKGAARLEYVYDAEHERAKETYKASGATQRTTVYLNPAAGAGLYFEEENGVAGLKRKHYISAGGMTIGMAVYNGSAWTMQYWHEDHLGSVSVVTNGAGAVSERMAYEPFGKRRQSSGTTDVYATLVPVSTDRGFTGHEHMDEVGLINMNGRVYDPGLGRFMSADPFIQSPNSLQSYNRYSYVWNSPLNSADPSGYRTLSQEWRNAWQNQTVQAVATIVISVACECYWGPAVYTGARVAYDSGSVEQGLKAGLISFAQAWAFNYVGDITGFHGVNSSQFLTEAHFANIIGHAVVGCAAAAASGGDCGQGAAGAALGSFVTPIAAGAGDFGVVVAAVAGGIGSKIAGGKFADGAVTAAFGYLYNQRGGRYVETLRNEPLEIQGRILELHIRELEPNSVPSTIGPTGGPRYTEGYVSSLRTVFRDVLTRAASRGQDAAWAEFRDAVREGRPHPSTKYIQNFGQVRELLSQGRIAGWQAHHQLDVASFPSVAANPAYIRPLPASIHEALHRYVYP